MGNEIIEDSDIELDLDAQRLRGWRLYTMAVCLLTSLYLVNLESTVITTSLFTITSDLQSFDQTSWIVTAYLVTYTGFIILWTRFCDILGWRNTYLTAMTIFLLFSLGCAVSQTGVQLIICRAFQGLGGGGTYSLIMLCLYQHVPRNTFATFSGLVTVTIALANITGPIIGGALGHDNTWRWLFYLNLPPGAIVLLLVLVSMPPEFSKTHSGPIFSSARSWKHILRRFDIPGIFLLLGGSLLLITVLDETNSHFSWSSARAIVLIILAAAFWIGFIVWEIIASNENYQTKPVFPRHFYSNWPLIGIFLTSFIVGIPYNSMIVYLPQRFQVLLNDSALMAGVRLLGYSGVTGFASIFAILFSTRLHVPFLPILIFSALANIIGCALLSTLPVSNEWPASGYGYEILAGCGMGIAYAISIFALPYMLDPKDVQEASGVIVQMRYLGSSVGVSISSNILNGRLKSTSQFLSTDAYDKLFHNVAYLSKLAPEAQHQVQQNLGQSYRIQFQVLIGFAIAQLAISLLLIRKGPQIRPSGA